MVAGANSEGVVMVWDAASGKVLHQLDANEESTTALALSPDGRRLAAGGDGDAIQVWNLETEHRDEQLKGHRDTISALAFSPDGTLLASGSDDRSIERRS